MASLGHNEFNTYLTPTTTCKSVTIPDTKNMELNISPLATPSVGAKHMCGVTTNGIAMVAPTMVK